MRDPPQDPLATYFDFNSEPMCMVMKFADREERGTLTKGGDGFLDAVFPDGRTEKTEQPNALLAARAAAAQAKAKACKKGKPAGHVVAKKPAMRKPGAAAANTETDQDDEGEEEEQLEPDEPVDAADEPSVGAGPPAGHADRGYSVMYYKRDHSIGLKRTHGEKNQFVSFGGKKYKDTLDEATLREIGAELKKALVDGTVADTKEAAKAEAERLVAQRLGD